MEDDGTGLLGGPPAIPKPDADLVDRWLAILGLLDAADGFAARRTGAWAGLAVVAADAAIEAALALIATGGPKPPEGQERFHDILAKAEQALERAGTELEPGTRERVLRTHRTRNSALHAGAEPPERAVKTAVAVGREIAELTARTSTVLGRIGMVGPVRAVAELVGVTRIGDQLIRAETALGAGEISEAADATAIALDVALRLLQPPLKLPVGHRLPIGSLVQDASHGKQKPLRIDVLTRPLEERMDLSETWTLALAIGIRPGDLREIRRTLGTVRHYSDGAHVLRDPAVVLTRPDIEGRLLAVATIVFRLFVNGELGQRNP